MNTDGRSHNRGVGNPRREAIEKCLLKLSERARHDPAAADAVQETGRKLFESEAAIRARTPRGVAALVATAHRNVKLDAVRREQTRREHVIPEPLDDIRLCAPPSHQPLDHVLRIEYDTNLAVVLTVVSAVMLEAAPWERSLIQARLRGTPTLRELGEQRGWTPQQVWREQVNAMRALYAELRRRLRAEHPDVYEYFFPWDAQ